jgi:hypothetical protein
MRRAPPAPPAHRGDLYGSNAHPLADECVMVNRACAPRGTGRQNRSLRRGFARLCKVAIPRQQTQAFADDVTGPAAARCSRRAVFDIAKCADRPPTQDRTVARTHPATGERVGRAHRNIAFGWPRLQNEVNLRPAEPQSRMRRATLPGKVHNNRPGSKLVHRRHAGRTGHPSHRGARRPSPSSSQLWSQ